MKKYAEIHTETDVVDAGEVTTSDGWLDFSEAIRAFTNISELESLMSLGRSNDGQALREDLEAVRATFELSEHQRIVSDVLLKISLMMKPGDLLTIRDDN